MENTAQYRTDFAKIQMPMISDSLDQAGGKILQKLRYAACLIFPLFIAKPLAAVELQFGCNYAICQ